VRPHPANVRIYEQLEGDNISVWPKGRNALDTDDFRRGFYNSLLYCVATVGINTTGMIDAVINDRPGITIMTETYRKTQMEAVHFRQLLKADVLEVAGSVVECIEHVRRIQQGGDKKQAERQRFVQDYIRPYGLEHPAGEIAAHAIELAGMGKPASEISQILAEQPV